MKYTSKCYRKVVNAVELIYVTLFAVLLNVAFCDETVVVSVDNTPVEVEVDVVLLFLHRHPSMKTI